MSTKSKSSKEQPKYPGVRFRNGKYHYRYSITNPETGKRKQKETPGYNSAKEAFQAGIDIEAELRRGTYVEEKNIIFSTYVDEWLKMYEAHGNVKNSTVFLRKVNLLKATKYFAHIRLCDITKKQYQSMLDDLKSKKLSYNTINLVHISCKMLFDTAVEQEILKSSPAASARLPSFQQTVDQLESGTSLPKYLEKNELLEFLETVKENGTVQEYALFFLLAYTGLRIGEACALKWRDINKIENYISITKTLYVREGVENYILNTPKTRSSIREVEISKKVVEVLDSQSLWQKQLMMAERQKYYTKGGFIFVNDQYKPGYPMIHEVAQRGMKKYLLMTGLSETLTPHSLRHTHASLLAEAGEDLEVIQKRLGHKNDQITRDIYTHVTKKRKKEAPLRFERFMENI
ncbi:tyrosine-type recombinase/integrase [Paenibacillus sp. RS8]|uniref:tyrosine-type recombinase/integrase n=1 Tax=Paenibacillus sp. RS8 TaxID=3242681 RepID=UPI0035BF9A93